MNRARKDAWRLEYKYFIEDETMNSALIERMLDLMDSTITTNFKEQQLTTRPKMKFLEAFDYFFSIYGTPDETEDDQNSNRMKAKWMPQQGIDALITKVEHGVTFAFFTNNPFTDKQLLNVFILHISRAGCYSSWLKDWRAKPENQKTYANAKLFWHAAHIQWMKESKGQTFGYGLNAQTYDADTDNVDDDDQDALQQEQQEAEARINQHAANHAAGMNALAEQLNQMQMQNQQQQMMMANLMANQQQQRNGQNQQRRNNNYNNNNNNYNNNNNNYRRNNNRNGGGNWNGSGWHQGAWNAMPQCPPVG